MHVHRRAIPGLAVAALTTAARNALGIGPSAPIGPFVPRAFTPHGPTKSPYWRAAALRRDQIARASRKRNRAR